MAEQEQPEAMVEQNPSNMIDKLMEALPQEDAPETASNVDEALEMQTEEATPMTGPDEGMMMQLYEIVYGGSYDPASPMDQQRLAQIEEILSNDPDSVEKLKSGEMSMTEFAIRVYRDDPNNPASMT
tara:strand:+ start:6543 stop:6923 length:381 start_codon:yes stop_codon:yes gene_type:complete